MYKTEWQIKINGKDDVVLAYYHFGKNPKFPTWYMEENHSYEIEMVWQFKLVNTIRIFLKCLFNSYTIYFIKKD